MGRRRKIDIDADNPHEFLSKVLLPKALAKLHDIIDGKVPRSHRQYVRSLTIQRAACATVVNAAISLQDEALRQGMRDKLDELLREIRENRHLHLPPTVVEQAAKVIERQG